jgi:hypothetical protein
MKHLKYIFVLLIASCAIPAMAQVPSGVFSYAFTNTPLWDTTGVYSNTSVSSDGITDDATVDITHAANGQITGTRIDTFTDGPDIAHTDGTISGKTSVKAGVTLSSLRLTGTASGTFDGHDFTGTIKGKSIDVIDASALTVVLFGTETISPKGGRSLSTTGTGTFDLPAGMTGDWTLENDITASGDKLSGTGMVTLSNGRIFTNLITGTYSTTKGVSILKLVGQGDAAGTGLLMTTAGTNMDLTALKGKILGQTPTILP